MPDAHVTALFERSDAALGASSPLRITDDGIFLATPLAVVEAALAHLGAHAARGDGGPTRLLDAGMGDGRIVALARLSGLGFEAAGLETDATLFEAARANLAALGLSDAPVGRGSFLDPGAYADLGLAPSAIDVVVNYPDGNEQALAAFFAEHGRAGALVAFVTPDLSLRAPALGRVATEALAPGSRLHLFRVRAGS